jgi:hypothetical protein
MTEYESVKKKVQKLPEANTPALSPLPFAVSETISW